MCITLMTPECGFGDTRAGTEFTSNSPAAGKTVFTWNVVRFVFAEAVVFFGAGAAGSGAAVVAAVVVVVVVVGAGVVPSAKDGAATIAAIRAASASRRASF